MKLAATPIHLRPELLISVRSPAEAIATLHSAVDILDFKEPSRGALAAVDPAVWHEAATLVQRYSQDSHSQHNSNSHGTPRTSLTLRLSAALGETDTAIALARQIPSCFDFAKAGPFKLTHPSSLRRVWGDVREALPGNVELVAVAYADSDAARCVCVEEVIELAKLEGFRRLLIDTYSKDGRSTIDLLGIDRLQEIRRTTRGAGLKLMLAGSLKVDRLSTWLSDQTIPDGFGIRGDVCVAGRESEICPQRIANWRAAIDTSQLVQRQTLSH